MGTWQPGVPYTDGTTDQITGEANTDRQEQGEAETGIGVGDLPTIEVVNSIRITPDDLLVIEKDGVTYQITAQQFAGYLSGLDNARTITGAGTLTPTDTSISFNSASNANLAVCNLTDAQLTGHQEVVVFQANTGEVTVVNGTNSQVTVTGTGRAKSRDQYSVIFVRPWLNFSGQTLWTVRGDTANA